MGRAQLAHRKKAAFLKVLAAGWSVSKAAETSKLPRRTAYDWREADPEFAKAWDEAVEQGVDVFEDELAERATDGKSDTLLIFRLKGARPEKYARFEVTGAKGGPVHVVVRSVLEEASGESGGNSAAVQGEQ